MSNNAEIEAGKILSLNETDLQKNILSFIDQLEGLDDYRLPQRAYHIIRLAVRDLILPPGKTILEREMAELLDMSRTPIREALVRLETEGVVQLVPRRGFIVEPIEKEDLKEIYEISEIMEGFAVAKAAKKIEERELEQLESLIDQQEEAIEQTDLRKWSILDDRFHHLIIEFAENKRLNAVIDIHADQLYRARLYTINQRPLPLQSIIEHKAIVACVKARDGNAARMVMQSHRKRARGEILKALEAMEQPQGSNQ
ncbi:GntR family transcriptional regulator [Bacillus thermotolerans]|uniref:Transcriptional regulator, GntR family n=1 Tax=Bacillus thermotolerans TaxID=1221996 RepID=A0A0F5HL64_BACTR|nr:GntR family transcriptional regulator [Bacillus thermotolerans]KKB33562.1 Transcriptional regulator, GntR family [Bacillus thermotolerans]KKB35161.1 Transcriptional regulator, GntR family [Bacillus thermotolerans]KKB38140.1 Transcriptional regulator, GntR family [Bacillus thermotolerans]